VSVVWHDLEYGSYLEDMPLWRSLASEYGDPVLEIGAGTGRVALDLARRGYRVTALDRDPIVLAELAGRAAGLELETVAADARRFELARRFSICIVPMQTIQLLGGPDGRREFLECARRHLVDSGALAVALAEELEPYEGLEPSGSPLPDMCELDGVVYSSLPTAVRAEPAGFVLERRRETVTAAGERTVTEHAIRLDRLTQTQLEREAGAAGLVPAGRARVPATDDYAGSEVVIVRA
jgi:SAM-dependent methyltransferase